jgi:hypothetical protein
MALPEGNRVMAQDSVCKLVQSGDLAKTLTTVRTVPGARNPFVAPRQGGGPSGSTSTSPNTSSGTQADRK